jgi:hypothetical protein
MTVVDNPVGADGSGGSVVVVAVRVVVVVVVGRVVVVVPEHAGIETLTQLLKADTFPALSTAATE